MKFLIAAAILGYATALPTITTTLKPRADNCEQWGSVVTGDYTVYNNLWNEGAADSGGSQCFSVSGLSSGVLSWATTWSWSGGSGQVKSYANAVLTSLTAKKVSAISSIPSTWAWTNKGSNVVADIAYDLFTSSTATGDEEFEIMIWLAALGGAGPISSTYGADGSATSIGSATIAGVSFDLYKGPNGQMTVYSFVATSTTNSFDGDLKKFFDYLASNESFDENQYLISAGAGTEAFEGSDVTFTTSKYSISVS